MSRPLRMLLVDDNPDDRVLVLREIRQEFPDLYVEQVKDENELARALATDQFDLVITDYLLHWSDGLTVLQEVKARHPGCPVIMFTGTGNEELAVEAMKRGLDDYVVKSARHVKRLSAAIHLALEKYRQQRALDASEEEFRQLLRFSPIPMAIYNDEGRVLFLNDRFVKLFGYTLEDIPELDAWWRAAYPDPEYRRHAIELWEAEQQTAREMEGEVQPLRLRIASKDGSTHLIELSGTTIGNKHLVLLHDVTKLRVADEKLILMAAIVESSDDAIICKDLNGVITSWNRGAEKIYGYGREEAIGKPIRIIFPAGSEREYDSILKKVRRGEHIEHLETQRRRKDGKILQMSISISPIRDEEGNIICASTIGSDITQRVILENQLRQAQKMEALGTLAGGVAHDFNNILTAIIGHASLLDLKMPQEDPLTNHVHQILEAASRAANLTQALLGFSRKKPIETKPIDLNAVIERVERLLVTLFKENVEFKTALCRDELVIHADPGQIEQVLLNLATNARDVIPAGGKVMVATATVELDEAFIKAHGYGKAGRYASLSFSDNGAGMDDETRLRIFEPFFTTKEIGKGTGLGLSIVYGIVKQHGGYITCYSEPGKGTTFQIYLPLRGPARKEEARPPEALPRGGTETILVAEDDLATRNLDKEVLSAYGYRVIEACDGEDAVTKFRENQDRIQLVFLDSIMPKKSGREVYEEIVKIKPDVKALFTSGYAADMFSEIEMKQFHFLPKPILPTLLLRKIREVLDNDPEQKR